MTEQAEGKARMHREEEECITNYSDAGKEEGWAERRREEASHSEGRRGRKEMVVKAGGKKQ